MKSSVQYIRDLSDGLDLSNLDDEVLDLEIVKVDLHRSNKEIIILCRSNMIIGECSIDSLKLVLRDRLSKFDFLDIRIQYKLDFIENFDTYKKNIFQFIKNEIKSSCGWIEELEIEVRNGMLYLIMKNEVAIMAFKTKEMPKKISQKIKSEFGQDISVKIENVCKEDPSKDYSFNKHQKEKQLIEEFSKKVVECSIEEKKSKPKSDNSQNKSKRRSRSIIKTITGEKTPVSEITIDSGTIISEGEVFDLEKKEIKGDKKIFIFNVTDFKNSVNVKVFVPNKDEEEVDTVLFDGSYIRFQGDAMYDTYSKQLAVIARTVQKLRKQELRKDNALEKRVELHCHTKMSSMDGVSDATSLIKRAADWGHDAIAITDHGVVQGFPEAMSAAKDKDIKLIYGVEGYLVDDSKEIVENSKNQKLNTEYTVFDIETTGFSPRQDRIIEIGAVKIDNGLVVDEFSKLIDPRVDIPERITELNGIDNNMVSGQEGIERVLEEFLDFIGDTILVAHNSSFDISFIRTKATEVLKRDIDNPVMDTLLLSRILYPELKKHKLNIVAKHLGVSLENHHRAVDDSRATAGILLKSIEKLEDMDIFTVDGLNQYGIENIDIKKERPYHIIIFAKDLLGLKNLYRIISESHLKHFYRKPRIPKSLIDKYREGIILGTACEAGELYQAIFKGKTEYEVEQIVDYYDFLEIQPIENNEFLIKKGEASREDLMDINRQIVDLGEKKNKKVVATGDVHFLDPEDEIYRRILMAGQGFSDADDQAPLYFKTTDEMLEDFNYLGEKKARKVVIENPNSIADSIDTLQAIPDGTYPPEIEGADDELREMNYKKAKSIYGDPLPDIVSERLEKELDSIIGNGYAVLYIISQKLVTKSLEDGYLVGSRGSVGSSFVATMSDITEVNPLPPHYICSKCKKSEFILDGSVGSGIDLRDANCPDCGTEYIKEGHDIPFEVFLGFEGDKEPDIDLNFAGEYQPVAHKYTEELFGEGYVFRAGTIGTVAEKTAYGFVRKYFESKEESVHYAEINRLLKGCTGVKRTSGQHPGGVMVVPSYKDVYDFTPVQYPADDSSSGVITTHFDYNAISGRILKLDILGHDVPSIIRMLEDLTGEKPEHIDLDDEETKKLFLGTESLGVSSESINSEVGTLGIPEFGTKFVRQMLVDTRPSTFSELVRISGLSHGTDVWINNAQELVRDGIAELSEVICTRDDIMNYLIYSGLEKKTSFKIMEKVRKGKGITDEEESYMRENGVPEWYIESCKKIKYMFPKAHAVAYVMMSFRIAYFKVHFPEAFYATYFTTKAADFDAQLVTRGKTVVKDRIKEIESLGNDKTSKEKNLLTVLEVVLEMYERGYNIENVDLYKSDSDKFRLGDKGIIPPLKALDGVGENAARSIARERELGEFISIEDLVKRTKSSKTVVEALRLHGCLNGIPETNQLNLFSI